jgi:hypothetical protein
MTEDFGFFTEVFRKAYPKSFPPVKLLRQLILADKKKSPQKLDRIRGQEVLIAQLKW